MVFLSGASAFGTIRREGWPKLQPGVSDKHAAFNDGKTASGSGWGLSNQNLHGWLFHRHIVRFHLGCWRPMQTLWDGLKAGRKLISGKLDLFSWELRTALGLAQDRPDYLYFRLYKEPGPSDQKSSTRTGRTVCRRFADRPRRSWSVQFRQLAVH